MLTAGSIRLLMLLGGKYAGRTNDQRCGSQKRDFIKLKKEGKKQKDHKGLKTRQKDNEN